MDCEFCNNKFEFADIKKYKYWKLQLFYDDQYFIGRSVAVLKDRHIVDITELKENERNELHTVVLPEIKKCLDKIFSPDLYNYSSLGNDCRHLHFHIIPRYKTNIYFNNKKFVDKVWNKHYSKKTYTVKLTHSNFKELKDILQLYIKDIG